MFVQLDCGINQRAAVEAPAAFALAPPARRDSANIGHVLDLITEREAKKKKTPPNGGI